MNPNIQLDGRAMLEDRVDIVIVQHLLLVLQDPFHFLLNRKQNVLAKQLR